MNWEVEVIVMHLVEKLEQMRKRSNRKIRKDKENEGSKEVNQVRDTNE